MTETNRLQKAIEEAYPQVFESVDVAVEKRNTARQALNDNPGFQVLNKKVVEAGRALKNTSKKCCHAFVSNNLSRKKTNARTNLITA